MTHSSFGLQPLKVRCTSTTAHPNGPGRLKRSGRQPFARKKSVSAIRTPLRLSAGFPETKCSGKLGFRNCFSIFAVAQAPQEAYGVRTHSSVGQSSGLIIRRSWDHAPLGPQQQSRGYESSQPLFLLGSFQRRASYGHLTINRLHAGGSHGSIPAGGGASLPETQKRKGSAGIPEVDMRLHTLHLRHGLRTSHILPAVRRIPQPDSDRQPLFSNTLLKDKEVSNVG